MKQDYVDVYYVNNEQKKSFKMTKDGFSKLNLANPGIYAIKEMPKKIIIPSTKEVRLIKIKQPKKSKTRQSVK